MCREGLSSLVCMNFENNVEVAKMVLGRG